MNGGRSKEKEVEGWEGPGGRRSCLAAEERGGEGLVQEGSCPEGGKSFEYPEDDERLSPPSSSEDEEAYLGAELDAHSSASSAPVTRSTQVSCADSKG